MEINSAYTANSTLPATSGASDKENAAVETKPYSSAYEYADYLSKKYDYFGRTSCVYGVPTIATVSDVFLQKCVDDPEKAKWLEDSLTAFAECTKWSNSCIRSMKGCPVRVFQSLAVDANGNMSCVSRTTNDPDGKIAKENAQKKAREKKAKARRLIMKKLRKLEQEERLDEQRERTKAKREAMKTHEVKVIGNDIRKMSRKMQKALLRMSLMSGTVGLDMKV